MTDGCDYFDPACVPEPMPGDFVVYMTRNSFGSWIRVSCNPEQSNVAVDEFRQSGKGPAAKAEFSKMHHPNTWRILRALARALEANPRSIEKKKWLLSTHEYVQRAADDGWQSIGISWVNDDILEVKVASTVDGVMTGGSIANIRFSFKETPAIYNALVNLALAIFKDNNEHPWDFKERFTIGLWTLWQEGNFVEARCKTGDQDSDIRFCVEDPGPSSGDGRVELRYEGKIVCNVPIAVLDKMITLYKALPE